jgi:tripartite-type tricarboxylate transporter receptor subunit TctC
LEVPEVTSRKYVPALSSAYAVAAKHRLAPAPEIPTVDEAGLPGFYYMPDAAWVVSGIPKLIPEAERIGRIEVALRVGLQTHAFLPKLIGGGPKIALQSLRNPRD